jgi:ribosomal protein S18 acetylase RimI-like enzyme
MPNECLADVKVRIAELTDAAGLAGLMDELGYETTPAQMEARLKTIIADQAYATFIAEIDGAICGVVGTFAQPSYEHNDLSGRILALVVSSNARRFGVGRTLIAAAEKHFVKRGITRIALTTRLTREDAHKFYEAVGYQRNGYRFVKTLGCEKISG